MDHLERFDEVLKYINELSGTIDLHTTLIRAESLFRRFQRMVMAIDKKSLFPPPRTNSGASGGSNSGAAKEEKVISPELRGLLSRKVVRIKPEASK